MNEPCRRYGVIGTAELAERRGVQEHDCGLNQTVPYGTGPFFDKSQAINCLATIIYSLRDKDPLTRKALAWPPLCLFAISG